MNVMASVPRFPSVFTVSTHQKYRISSQIIVSLLSVSSSEYHKNTSLEHKTTITVFVKHSVYVIESIAYVTGGSSPLYWSMAESRGFLDSLGHFCSPVGYKRLATYHASRWLDEMQLRFPLLVTDCLLKKCLLLILLQVCFCLQFSLYLRTRNTFRNQHLHGAMRGMLVQSRTLTLILSILRQPESPSSHPKTCKEIYLLLPPPPFLADTHDGCWENSSSLLSSSSC